MSVMPAKTSRTDDKGQDFGPVVMARSPLKPTAR
jgi:hypothetical protein